MAQYGMVGVAADYRRADRKSISALDAMKDANSSVRWVRMHAEELNIDTDKVLAYGFSAGAHLAISTAMFPQFKEESEDASISSIPNAIITVVPPVSVNQDPYFQSLLLNQQRAKNCSPIDNIRPGIVPIYVVSGTKDEILPLKYLQKFEKKMRQAGNTVEMYMFEGGGHNFFYDGSNGECFYKKSIADIAKKLSGRSRNDILSALIGSI